MELLMTFIIWSFLAYGWTNIMCFGSSIIQTWREFWQRISPNFFGKLFSCPMCLGTWVGFFLSYVFQHFGLDTPMTSYGVGIIPLAIFLDGVFTSGIVWFIHTVQEWFEYRPEN